MQPILYLAISTTVSHGLSNTSGSYKQAIEVMQGTFLNHVNSSILPCYEWIRYRVLYSDL